MRRRRAAIVGIALLFTIAPSIAAADAGTPLIWGTFFQLTIGNLLIGVFEAWLLARYFGAARGASAVGRIVLGNYASCAAGIALFAWTPVGLWLQHLTGADRSILLHARGFMAALGIATWVVSILVEAPFVWWVLPKERRGFTRAMIASLAAQSASYVVLAFCCLGVSDFGMYRYAHVQPNTAFAGDAWRVYYRENEDGFVWSRRIDGTNPRKESAGPIPTNSLLLVGTAGSPTGVWKVVSDPPVVEVATRVPAEAFHWPQSVVRSYDPYRLVDFARIGGAYSHYYLDPWGGFLYQGDRYAIETIGGSLSPERMIVLPDDRAVFATADGEIDVFDPKTQTIGFFIAGRSPVVLPETP